MSEYALYTPTTNTVRRAASDFQPPITPEEFDRWLAAHDAEVLAGVVAEEPETVWQWSYVEKWVDDSGVYERVTFDSEDRARRYFRNNVERVEGLNQEFEADDQIIASIEKRRTSEPGEWVPVKQEGAEAGA